MPGTGAIALAITIVTQKRSAFLYPQRGIGHGRVTACCGALGVVLYCTVFIGLEQEFIIPVVTPFPNITGHIVQAIAVGSK